MVKNWKTFFYIKADENWRDRPYVPGYDVLGILEVNSEWLRAEYLSYKVGKPVQATGWAKAWDVYGNVFQ